MVHARTPTQTPRVFTHGALSLPQAGASSNQSERASTLTVAGVSTCEQVTFRAMHSMCGPMQAVTVARNRMVMPSLLPDHLLFAHAGHHTVGRVPP